MVSKDDSIIELQNISLFRGKTQILKDISWKINKQSHWELIGPNGSGKTTLLKIVSGYLFPSKGSVRVLGKEFGKTDIRELRKKIGWVSSYLVEKIPKGQDILEIIISGKYSSFGIYEKIKEKDKKEALKLLNLLDCKYVKDRSFEIISQGEKQKVLIARGLMGKPLILLLDEPCIGLDMKAWSNLLKSISKICKNKKTTIVYVTHHIEEVIREVENVLLLKNGRVFDMGKKSKVLNKRNLSKLFD